MAINPTRLRPSDVVRLVNSTPVGPVLIDRQLRRHRDRAGFRVTDDGGQSVNIFKYAAWLSDIWFETEANPPQTYEEKKAAVRNRNIALALAGRDIGELPEVAHPELKESCRRDFRRFCETYFPETFSLAWSPDHLKAIARIETAVLEGGLFALAMPRAAGKALALDTPLATPAGWTTMGEVKVGDTLFDERGCPCRVILKSEVFIDHDCYRVTFSDGESIVCDAGHLWQVEDIFGRKNPYIRTTEWLSKWYTLEKRGIHKSRFCIPMQANQAIIERLGCTSHTSGHVRMIDSIVRVPTVPTQCVMVDSPSHLYLAGRKMVPTHNSSLTEVAAIWSMLYGHREFVTLIGATETAALEILESIKTEFEVNDHLAEDFPEVIHPIKCLDGIANRCAGQLYQGERTRITWTSNELVLPTIAESPASGIIVRVAGITGRVRGMKFKRADGRSVRPSLVIIDDPQTSESAGSLEQTRKRVRVLAGDILGLAGPGQKISGIMPCTIIRPGDMAEQILDREKHPEWNGERTKLLYEYPKNTKLWEEYAELRANALREEGNFRRATEFYAAHREAMDEGAVVAWKERYNFDELSALQYAMNLKLQDEGAFQSEYQNDPLPDDIGGDTLLSVDEIASKVNGLAAGKVPLACDKVTAFVDIQKSLLFYAVVAWNDEFTGAVLDYGAWPDQRRKTFSLATANPTIQSRFPNAGLEGCIYGALSALMDDLLEREWAREDGAMLKIERAMIDANWGSSTDVVYQFCRQSPWGGIVYPSHGRYVGASSKPMTDYRKQPGDKLGFNWMMPNVAGKRAIRHVIFDSNFWKSFIQARLAVPLGDRSSLSFYGRHPHLHQLIAEHLTAEYRVKTAGRGRIVDEWKLRPDRSDNHWLDCLAGCAVCASMLGATMPEFGAAMKLRRKETPIRLSELRSSIETASVNRPARAKIRLSELRAKKSS